MKIAKIICYILTCINFIFIIALYTYNQNGVCYEDTCSRNLVTFGGLFVITLCLAIIFSIKQDKNK